MTTIAQGIVKKLAFKKQAGLGVPSAGAGGQVLRRVSAVFTAARDTFKSTEINTKQQSTGVGYGLKKVTAKISGLLSPETWSEFLALAMRKDFAATAAYAAGNDVTAAAAGPQFVDASAGFLTAGLKVGDVGRWSGFTAAHNNGRNFLITALTAGNMTGVFLDASAVVAEAAGNAVTFTVVGKKTLAPLTGHTNDYYTFEDWYSDVSKSELFADVKANQIDIAIPATGNATISMDMIGLSRTLGDAQVLTAPTPETTTPLLTSVNGAIFVGGNTYPITGLQFSMTGNMSAGDAIIGSNSAVDIARGIIEVSGQFTALFSDSVISALYDSETPSSLIAVVADDVNNPTSDFMGFSLGRIKLTGDAPDDGQKMIVRTYPFTAEVNVNGGAALAWDETILTIQDSAAP